MVDLCALVLHRDVLSEDFTGLVFAGFGADEMFPSLRAFEIDGVIADRLKKRQVESFDANRNELSARILPFAQKDIVDRFLDGIDAELESGLEDYLSRALAAIKQHAFDGVKGTRKAAKAAVEGQISLLSEAVLQHYREDFMPAAKGKLRKQMEDTVLFMPKP
ncbi:hypothetical protein GCM10009416_02740 [Craurococcus roseus]|uniref:Uncharacterized protein n=1 Tax=Craurococcus roseus TaxID=77585 RepID=A0ABN1EKS0_9PROT